MDRTRKYVHTSSTIPATTMTAANCHNCWHLKLRPHPGIWDLAHPLFCRGHDLLPVRAPDSDLRLPAFCRAATGINYGRTGSNWQPRTASRSNPLARRMCAKRTWSRRCWPSEGSTPGWSRSSRRWSPARPSSRGTTRRRARPTCGPTTANACITIFTLSRKN